MDEQAQRKTVLQDLAKIAMLDVIAEATATLRAAQLPGVEDVVCRALMNLDLTTEDADAHGLTGTDGSPPKGQRLAYSLTPEDERILAQHKAELAPNALQRLWLAAEEEATERGKPLAAEWKALMAKENAPLIKAHQTEQEAETAPYALRMRDERPESSKEEAARAARGAARMAERLDGDAWEAAEAIAKQLQPKERQALEEELDLEAPSSREASRASSRLSGGVSKARISDSVVEGNTTEDGRHVGGRRQGSQNADGSKHVTGPSGIAAQRVLESIPSHEQQERLLQVMAAEVDLCLECSAVQDAVVAAHAPQRAGTTSMAGGGGQIRLVERALRALGEVKRFEAAVAKGSVPRHVVQRADANKAAAELRRTLEAEWEEAQSCTSAQALDADALDGAPEDDDDDPLLSGAPAELEAAAAAGVEGDGNEGPDGAGAGGEAMDEEGASASSRTHPPAPTTSRYALARLARLWEEAGLIGAAAEVHARYGPNPFWLLRHVAMRLAIQRQRVALQAVTGLDCSYLLRLGMQSLLLGYNDKLGIATGRVMGRLGIASCYKLISKMPLVRPGALTVTLLVGRFTDFCALKELTVAAASKLIFGEGEDAESQRLRGACSDWVGRRKLNTPAVKEAAKGVRARAPFPPASRSRLMLRRPPAHAHTTAVLRPAALRARQPVACAGGGVPGGRRLRRAARRSRCAGDARVLEVQACPYPKRARQRLSCGQPVRRRAVHSGTRGQGGDGG